MKTENIQDIYELTPLQHGILFHSLYAPETAVYFVQLCYSLRGNLDAIAFERAWQAVVDRQTILRTAFYWEDLEKPLQVVNKNVTIVLQQYDWRGKTTEEQKLQLQDFLESDRVKGFDFSLAPLMRLFLIRCANDFYYFIWSKHHLILDGWSTALVLKEVVEIYQALEQGQEFPLVSKTDYKNYIKWLQKQDSSQTEVFWRQILSDFKTPTSLKSIECDRVSEREKKYESQSIKLSQKITEKLQAFARTHKLTLNTIVQGAWAILLGRYSGQEDIIFGVTVSGRPTDLFGAETMVGMFINTLPIRVKLNGERHLLSWLVELQNQQLVIRQYQHSSLVDIQSWSEVSKGLPLLESIFVFENYPIDEKLKIEQKSLEIQNISTFDRSNYPLTISVIPSVELEIAIAYDGERFESATINRVLGHFQTLLEQMSENSEVSLKDLIFLTTAEQHQLLIEWNDTKTEYPQNKCVHQLFEEQVEKTPDAIAVVFEEQQLTYKELNDRANRLAHHLQTLGVKPEMLVGICLKRSLEMVIGLLGILKAGGAYLPLDPEYPQERLAFVLSDAKANILLTQQALLDKLLHQKEKIVCIDTQWREISQQSDRNPNEQVEPDNLAYTIYTSGSTGKPKGVQILHKALVNFLNSMRLKPGLSEKDILLSVTTLSFDIAALEIYLPLIVGCRLALVSREVAIDAIALLRQLDDARATVMQATPATWRMLLESGWKGSEQLKILCGGEALNYKLANQLIETSAEVWNLYGPTETTIWSAIARVTTETLQHQQSIVSIGCPLANTQFYILDRHLQPVPIGVIGEMYIAGDGVARGYLNRAELTAEKLIPNPFSEKPGTRLYKTGDLARYRADGEIEYIGRIDHQIKLRGYRIELGEIEAALRQHRAVAAAVVLLREDIPGNPHLVAYVMLPTQKAIATELKQHLESKLPKYMMPSAFVVVDAFPLTPNGKIDRKALPAPDGERLVAQSEYLAPSTPTQEILALIWQEILGVERVGASDNFFELGGHSLLATRVVSQIRQTLKVELPLRSLFEKPTLADLAQEIETATKANLGLEGSTIHPISRTQEIPLSLPNRDCGLLPNSNPTIFFTINPPH
ncbi:MAG: amino acid adenylation domain-containing protein [Hydrococcus sp. CRU_1_1]|nr:amino acid adenylation domain-containing protein [Hydrococcus sp. CRU_1_1]